MNISLSATLLSNNSSFSTPSAPPVQKNIFQKLRDQYSLSGQQTRIDRGERLFRAAQFRAMDLTWYKSGRIPNEFRPRHAILTMHIWLLHKRLLMDKVDTHNSLLLQEELFDILWSDTRTRIRAEGISELTVSKHLKDIQQITFQHCMHYDHAFTFDDPVKRREEIALVIWTHVLMRSEDSYNDHINRLALYVEWQYQNIMNELPAIFFEEGRIHWGDVPDFSQMKDNEGSLLEEVILIPEEEEMKLPTGWHTNITELGDTYFWNEDTMESQWDRPSK